MVNLVGVQSNSRRIGGCVTVTSTSGMSLRQNNGGGGGANASQGSEPVHFGIGTATKAQPRSGITDVLASMVADSTLTVTEGTSLLVGSKLCQTSSIWIRLV